VSVLALAAAAVVLHVSPATVSPGGAVTVSGAGWAPRSAVELLAGPKNSEAERFATVRTNATGAFSKPTRLSTKAVPGVYVFLACQRSCAIKATARLRVAKRSLSARATFIGFRTPSGNIGCGYWKFSGETAGFRCDIGSGLRPLPRPKTRCDADWGEAVSMAPHGRAGPGCISDTMRDPRYPALAYGKTWSHGGFTCRSETTGLTCRNLDGHGWFLSRERSRIF